VLVLDAHTNQALACVRSLGRAGYDIRVASQRSHPLAAWSHFSRGTFRLDGETVAAFARLRAWATAQGVHTVLPVTERSCRLLNAERGAWEASGIIVGCAPDGVLLRAFDKAQTLKIAERCGVRIPPTVFAGSLDQCLEAGEVVGFPCVVKSRFSNAWDGQRFLRDHGASYVADPAKLEATILAHRQGQHWPLIQSFVRGRGGGVSTLCDGGRAITWFAHERLRDVRPSGSGSSLRRSIALSERFRDAADRLVAAMEWHGPAMVEFRDDGLGEPYLMEVNGRFWGSLELAIAAGTDFPRLWVSLLHGERVDPMTGYAEGVIVRWLWGDVKRFLYILAGPPKGFPGVYPARWEGLKELFGRQPDGTRLEAWDRRDPWPAVGEWVQGLGDLLGIGARRESAAEGSAVHPDEGLPGRSANKLVEGVNEQPATPS
jgi:predicted ATP-grasp superfamily ATP-dependent carboligase